MNHNQVIVSINGKIVSPAEASISVLDSGLLAGLGVFETLLAEDKYIFRLREHLARLGNSRIALGLPTNFSAQQIEDFIREALDNFPADSNEKYRRIRVTLTGGNTGAGLWGTEALDGSLIVIIQEHTLPKESEKPSAEIVSSASSLHWLTEHKVISRMALSHPAPSHSSQNFQILYHQLVGVTEFGFASLFVRKGKMVVTSPDKDVFPGICRAGIIKDWPAIAPEYELKKQKLETADLLNADEVIGVNSLRTAFSIFSLKDNTGSPKSVTFPKPILTPELRAFLLNH